MSSRYLIGIDLGTTNSAVAYVDGRSADKRVALFEVPQLVAPGELAPRRQLPSFLYLAGEHDLPPAETALPWGESSDDEPRLVAGELARAQGARMPERMISSAKSWLCHGGVDREAAILPWGSDEPARMSPVDAQAAILRHIRLAWDHEHRDARFADQEVMVTVPASFDEAARELTQEAARRAGYGPIVLLEEPQAAFYAWVDSNPAGARAAALGAGSRVLVFDIGGGTTDFTLIAVGGDGESFDRTAVGDHLLLGGDNVDLTLARQVEQRLVAQSGRKLDALEWHGLVHSCRLAKETLLGDESLESVPISVAGRGSRLIGGARRDQVTRPELDAILIDGFFPPAERGAALQKTRGGLQELGGLPYAPDPAVTRHLAGFLARHEVARVDAVLFNGGAMTPAALRRRVIDQIAAWQDGGAPRELANRAPELAVAQGAAYYGLVRRGLGARIRGGTPRAFYVGAAKVGGGRGDTAVCVAPKGLEEGSAVVLERDFELVTNRPVSFRLLSSSSRDDQPGALVPIGDGTPDTDDDDSDLLELPPVVTVLRAPGRSRATVRLEVRITELGALEIWCRERDGDQGRWRLSFDMRAGGAARPPEETSELDPKLAGARELVTGAFRGGPVAPAGLVKAIEELLDARRDEWPVTTSRALFDAALEVEEERRRSPDHEARWLNLCGFCLRPGHGAPLDEWRSRQMWRVFNLGLVHEKAEACRLSWWILWRRIAGGLTQGQQEQIYDRLAQLFLPSMRQKKKLAEIKPTRQETAEMLRTLANLERLTVPSKIKLGDEVVRRLQESRKAREEALFFWALGRIGARAPLYGPANAVVPPQRAGEWLAAALDLDWPDLDKAAFPMAQLGRRTGDRARDLDDPLRASLAARLRGASGGERLARLVEEVVALEAREERVALGDTLPAGLRLLHDD
ncbi:MAG TPA: Hsp70 family protein [Kofleriaceae bacterium]|nr:Hsp70 family protein [Kofleriaceae bacterium]